MHLAKTLLYGLWVEAEAVEPDVVLGQADVDVECVVFFGALEERGDYCGGTDEAGLIVRVGCRGLLAVVSANRNLGATYGTEEALLRRDPGTFLGDMTCRPSSR